jgi:hypothetical protein
MSSHLNPKILALKAGADLSALQYTFVKFGADAQHVVGAGDGEKSIGVLLNAPASGEMAEVAVGGGAELKVIASTALGDSLQAGTLGKGKVVTSGYAHAIAMSGGAAGDVIPVLIDRHVGV